MAHLLDAARAAFVADGFDRVSIDGIARDAGVSKETIYRHFPDKQALFRAALDDRGNRFIAQTRALHRTGLHGAEALDALARAIMDAAVDGGLLSPLWLAAGLGTRMPDLALELQQAQAARMEPVRAAIEALARAQGVARTIGIDDALDFGSLAVEGSRLLMGFDPPPNGQRAALGARAAALFAEGVLAMPTPPASGHGTTIATVVQAEPAQTRPPHVRRLLEVAATHFLRDGYESASLGAIGAEAKVGRGTLYRHFRHKAGLFDAVLRDLAARQAGDAAPPVLPSGKQSPDDAVAAIQRYFAAATAQLTGRESIALHRAAISASRRDPALARAIHDAVRAPWIAPLARWVAESTGLADAMWLASQGIVLAMQGNRAIAAGHGSSGDPERHAARVTALFLHGLRG
ncbi:MAG: TetR/AcrR family transcriptional regulator [Novosphingobium sp.]|nr:TetR/AcrR family transcriptional regulator [Novosphingobium sp.]